MTHLLNLKIWRYLETMMSNSLTISTLLEARLFYGNFSYDTIHKLSRCFESKVFRAHLDDYNFEMLSGE